MDNKNVGNGGAGGSTGAYGNMGIAEVVEKVAPSRPGIPMLVLTIVLCLVTLPIIIFGAVAMDDANGAPFGLGLAAFIVGLLYWVAAFPILLAGLRVLKPQEAYVLTLFGNYHGTLKGPGFFFVHPFSMAVSIPFKAAAQTEVAAQQQQAPAAQAAAAAAQLGFQNKRISLKALTLNNERQKINDQLGNPIIIGIVVIWRVVNTARAAFCVDNYFEYLSIQCDSALRNIVRLYPYDLAGDRNGDGVDDSGSEKSLRGSSQEISERLRNEIQEKAAFAGLEIMEARITHLSYAPEIAAAMLQRQQATAIVDARQMIVEGAVGMVEMALNKLNERDVVQLDDERKAAMVSNLMVVLCSNKDAQPIVNSGTLY